MSGATGHICVVCGTEIPDHHGRFVLPMGHVHQGCKARMRGVAVSGEGSNFRLRRSSMLSCAPEAEALKYQWSKNFHPPDLYLQRNEGPCAQGPNHQDAANYYKMNQSAPENAAHLYQWFGDFKTPGPGCETACPVPAPSAYALAPRVSAAPMGAEERIMRAQSQSWAGWKALRGGVSGPLPLFMYAPPAESTPSPTPDSTEEKFADPFYTACTGLGTDGTAELLPYVFPESSARAWHFDRPGFNGIGYEYLASVPNNAVARVAAMRAKIEVNGDQPSQLISQTVDLSLSGIRHIGMDIARRYREAKSAADAGDFSKVNELAATFKIPASQIMGDYKKIVDTIGYYSPDSKEFLEAVWKSFSPQLLGVAREVASSISKAVAGTGAEMSPDMAAAFGSAAGVVPVIGQMVKIIIDLYSAWAADLARHEAEACIGMNRLTADVIQKTLLLSLPPPLHILEAFPNAFKCSSETGESTWNGWQQEAAQSIAFDNLLKFVGRKVGFIPRAMTTAWGTALPIPDQEIISWWWGLATTMMSNPQVETVFRAMGRDVNGGGFASDEQVMLVAAPIAVAYGLDVDDFARKLWNASPGWGSRPELFFPYSHGNLDGILCTVPAHNAMQIQWALLAQTAYDLAERMKKENDDKEKEKASFFMVSPEYTKMRAEEEAAKEKVAKEKAARTPEILGGIATGIMALAGTSLLLAAAPLAIGLWLSRKKAQAITSAPIPAAMFTITSPAVESTPVFMLVK